MRLVQGEPPYTWKERFIGRIPGLLQGFLDSVALANFRGYSPLIRRLIIIETSDKEFNTGTLSTIPFVLFLDYRFPLDPAQSYYGKNKPPLFERNEELR